jgi:hypothetical protein
LIGIAPEENPKNNNASRKVEANLLLFIVSKPFTVIGV